MLYDYRCIQCSEVFEVQRRLADESAVGCPRCASNDTRKVFLTTPQISVAWYRTMGLGHSGQISLAPVKNEAFRAAQAKGEAHG